MKGGNNMKERFAKLVDVKTIVTLALVAAAIAFVAVGKLESKVIENLVVMAVSFYLGTKIAEKNI
jgi:galactitol-specific phosphotransferase system IIC component